MPLYGVRELAKVFLPNEKFIDGRYELTISGSALFYVMATTDGNTNTAISLSQSKQATGIISSPSTNTYGRSAGVYEASQLNGNYDVNLPSAQANIGFCFNTTSKFNSNFQEQSTSAVMRLSDSSPLHYGNYGVQFNQVFKLINTTNRSRKVRLYLASNNHAQNSGVRNNQLTYNGPIRVNGAKSTWAVRGDNPKQYFAEWTIPANGFFNASLTGYLPGLLTANQQIIFQTQD